METPEQAAITYQRVTEIDRLVNEQVISPRAGIRRIDKVLEKRVQSTLITGLFDEQNES